MSKSFAVVGEKLSLLSESLIAERTDELSRHRIGYCGRPDQQAGTEHQGGGLEKMSGRHRHTSLTTCQFSNT